VSSSEEEKDEKDVDEEKDEEEQSGSEGRSSSTGESLGRARGLLLNTGDPGAGKQWQVLI